MTTQVIDSIENGLSQKPAKLHRLSHIQTPNLAFVLHHRYNGTEVNRCEHVHAANLAVEKKSTVPSSQTKASGTLRDGLGLRRAPELTIPCFPRVTQA
ncbi:MAG: hypothetical protein P4L56_25140, partial [Candidatus Sulfopaludibacter sp.]|nr:hypothetical protein [Candidatus Sulfopaludibacter sp.]